MDYLLQLKDVLGNLPDPLLYKFHLNKELRQVLISNKVVTQKNMIKHIKQNNYPSIIQSNIEPSNKKEFLDWIITSIKNKCHHIYDHFYKDIDHNTNIKFMNAAVRYDNVYVFDKLIHELKDFNFYKSIFDHRSFNIILHISKVINYKFSEYPKKYDPCFIDFIGKLFDDEKYPDNFIKQLIENDPYYGKFEEFNIILIDKIKILYRNRSRRFRNIFGYSPDNIDDMIEAYNEDNFIYLDKFFFCLEYTRDDIMRLFNLIRCQEKRTFQSLLRFNEKYISDNDLENLLKNPNKYNVYLALLRDNFLEVFRKYKDYIDGEIIQHMENYSPMILKQILDNFSLPKNLYINVSDHYNFYKQRDCIDIYKKLGIDLYKIKDGVYKVQELRDFIRGYGKLTGRYIKISTNKCGLIDTILKFTD